MLTTLPPELLPIIFDNLDLQSLKNINPTCKNLGRIAAETRKKYHPTYKPFVKTVGERIERIKILADDSLIYVLNVLRPASQRIIIEKNNNILYTHVFTGVLGYAEIYQLENGLIVLLIGSTVWTLTRGWVLIEFSSVWGMAAFANYMYLSGVSLGGKGVKIVDMESHKHLFVVPQLNHPVLTAVNINNHHIIGDLKQLVKVSLQGELIARKTIEFKHMLAIEDKILVSTFIYEYLIIVFDTCFNEIRSLRGLFSYGESDLYSRIYKFGNRFIIPLADEVKIVDMNGEVVNTYLNHAKTCCKGLIIVTMLAYCQMQLTIHSLVRQMASVLVLGIGENLNQIWNSIIMIKRLFGLTCYLFFAQ